MSTGTIGDTAVGVRRQARVHTRLEKLKITATLRNNQDKLAHQVTVDAVEMGLQMQAQAEGKLNASAEPT